MMDGTSAFSNKAVMPFGSNFDRSVYPIPVIATSSSIFCTADDWKTEVAAVNAVVVAVAAPNAVIEFFDNDDVQDDGKVDGDKLGVINCAAKSILLSCRPLHNRIGRRYNVVDTTSGLNIPPRCC